MIARVLLILFCCFHIYAVVTGQNVSSVTSIGEPFIGSNKLVTTKEGLNLNALIGTQVNFGCHTSNLRCFASIGGSYRYGAAQGDLASSINLYTGGVGTHQGVTGRPQIVSDFNISGGFTLGFGKDNALPITVFHNLSGHRVVNSYAGALSFGLIETISTRMFRQKGRRQENGYLFLRGGPASLGMYNDLFAKFVGVRQNDSYWTGGGVLFQVNTGVGMLEASYHGFTGERPSPAPTSWVEYQGHKYYVQEVDEQRYNNGQTSIRFNYLNYVFGLNHLGHGVINGQYLQNFFHDKKDFNKSTPRFFNDSKETWQLSIGGLW